MSTILNMPDVYLPRMASLYVNGSSPHTGGLTGLFQRLLSQVLATPQLLITAVSSILRIKRLLYSPMCPSLTIEDNLACALWNHGEESFQLTVCLEYIGLFVVRQVVLRLDTKCPGSGFLVSPSLPCSLFQLRPTELVKPCQQANSKQGRDCGLRQKY